jgi:hypothetical protein
MAKSMMPHSAPGTHQQNKRVCPERDRGAVEHRAMDAMSSWGQRAGLARRL